LKINLVTSILMLHIILLASVGQVNAQESGKIFGKITDKKTGETLIGLSVKIAGTTSGVSTNVNGQYVLAGLNPGKYTLVFSYIGYQSKQITDIDVASGKTTTLDIVMDEALTQNLKEVVITASAKQESTNTLYAQQKNSSRISDGVSAESIKKSPDKNTADVLKRVSGATIQDNKFVIVRGLSDRYNSATLDNGALPSSEPNRKAFSFDIVPSNMIDNIVISKTATPDMSGDFAGGAVQILTKDIPDQNFISYGVGYSYNSQSTFKDFKGTEKTFGDYAGFKASRNLPSNFPKTAAVVNGLTTQQSISAIKSLNNDFQVYNTTALPGQNYQLSFGRVKDFEKTANRFGAIFSLSYRNSQITNPEVQKELFNQFKYVDQTYKFSTSLGVLANFAYFFGKSKITLKNVLNRIQDDQYVYRSGSNLNTSTFNKFFAFDLIQKTLLKSTLDGEHQLGESKTKLKWTLGFSDIINNQPDQRKISYYINQTDINDPTKHYAANILGIGKENTRLFSNLNEAIFSGEVSLSLPLSKESNKGTFKTGLSSVYRNRTFDVRFLGLVLPVNANNADLIRERSLSTIFGSDLINQGVYKLDEIGNSADRYTSNSATNSAYAMLDNKFGEKLRVVWGLRAEQFNLNLQTFDPTIPAVSQSQFDLLPSANFTYTLTEKTNLRASIYKTVARPEFRELSPFAYYDYEQLAIQFGNPNLKRTQILNADLRFESYPAAGQIFSISAFYKKFTNAIETTFYDVNSTPDISYSNAEKATTYGLEFEFRKTLDFITSGKVFKNTTFYSNISIIHSAVNFAGDQNPFTAGRPLIGQSPYVINAGLQHSTLTNNLSLNLLYNRIGRRIYRVGGTVYPSVWEDPRNVLDFQVGYKVFKAKGEFKLNAGDILNEQSVFYFDRNTNKKYTQFIDDEISKTKLGTTISLSFNYSF
jgi:TonB-dependent receptor